MRGHTYEESIWCPGAPLTYFNDGGGGLTEVHILYPKKSQLQNLSTQKNPSVFLHQQIYWSSGKIKHANFNVGFGQKQNYKLHLCYFLIWADEKYNTQKNPSVVFATWKIAASFTDPKKSLLAKISDQKNPSDPPSLKLCEWGPWDLTLLVF